jgi:death on curing protein
VIRFLDVPAVEALHRIFDKSGVRDYTSLRSAVAEPQQGAFGVEFHPTIEDKAAALFRGLAQNHPFVDGNKRTALMAADVFLRGNGKAFKVETDALVDLTLAVARAEMTVDELAQRISEWTVPVHRVNRSPVGRAAEVLAHR